MTRLDAGMMEDLPAGHHLIGNAAEARGDFDVAVSGILALVLPAMAQHIEVVVAPHQIVRDGHDGGSKTAVAKSHELPAGIDLVALVARRIKTRASRDAPTVGVMLDGAHLASEVGVGDDIHSGE